MYALKFVKGFYTGLQNCQCNRHHIWRLRQEMEALKINKYLLQLQADNLTELYYQFCASEHKHSNYAFAANDTILNMIICRITYSLSLYIQQNLLY
jgi:hypothetical protein